MFMLLRQAACAAAIAVAATTIGVDAAQARVASSLTEAIKFARTEMARLCNDKDASSFDELGDETVRSSCQVTLDDQRLALQVRFRDLGAGAALGAARGAAGQLHKRMAYGRESYFFCSQFGEEELTALYMSCHFESSLTDYTCAEREIRLLDSRAEQPSIERVRSFARIISLSPPRCEAIKDAMNFIAARSRNSTRGTAARFFGDSAPR